MMLRRRALLKIGGSAAVVAALAAGPGAKAAYASVPPSQRFDLTKPSHELFRGKALRDSRVMQSFTFDNVNRRLFAAQLMNGPDSEARGDMCITQLDFSGKQLGYMYLKGFGHGVSIGVQPLGSSSYLWTEVDSVNERGTQLARFKFTTGTTLTTTSAALRKHRPIPGTDQTTCATDPVYQRLAMRYHTSSGFRFAVYPLADVANGNYRNKLADVATPAGLGTFQGYAVYGQYLYLYDGNGYSGTNPPPGNTYLTCVDLNSGMQIDRRLVTIAAELTHREPEGLAIYRTAAGETRLYLGFASGAEGDRRANLFYKNELI